MKLKSLITESKIIQKHLKEQSFKTAEEYAKWKEKIQNIVANFRGQYSVDISNGGVTLYKGKMSRTTPQVSISTVNNPEGWGRLYAFYYSDNGQRERQITLDDPLSTEYSTWEEVIDVAVDIINGNIK